VGIARADAKNTKNRNFWGIALLLLDFTDKKAFLNDAPALADLVAIQVCAL
jgi:hypothetical protein